MLLQYRKQLGGLWKITILADADLLFQIGRKILLVKFFLALGIKSVHFDVDYTIHNQDDTRAQKHRVKISKFHDYQLNRIKFDGKTELRIWNNWKIDLKIKLLEYTKKNVLRLFIDRKRSFRNYFRIAKQNKMYYWIQEITSERREIPRTY